MLREITLGQYYPAESVLHSLDPRVKLFSTLVFIITLFAANNVILFGFVLLTLFGIIKMSHVPFSFMVKGLRSIIVLLIIAGLFNLFLTPGKTLVSFWIFTMRRRSWAKWIMSRYKRICMRCMRIRLI